MSLGSRINEIRREKGISIDELSDRSGVPKGTLSKITAGITNNPTLDTVRSIATALGCRLDDFDDNQKHSEELTYSEKTIIKKYRLLDPSWKEAVDNILNIGYHASTSAPQEEQPRGPDQDKIIYIFPGYSMPMSAGTGQPAGDEYHKNYRLVKEPPRRASFIAPVSGNSMEPSFHNGDLVFVRAQEEVEIGQVGVFFMDGQQWIKELGEKELISHNPNYDPIQMREDIVCQGLVLGVCDKSYFEQ